MKIEKFSTGKMYVKSGCIVTRGSVRMGRGEGCGVSKCGCSEGYWISIIMPVNRKGTVDGIKVLFNNKKEMDKFFNTHTIDG